MARIFLYVRAPFAAFRPMQAGSLRATVPMMTYSAAWGLLLNLAGIETRGAPIGATTGINLDAPPLRVVLGLPGAEPTTGSLFQQAHAYPIGNTSAHLKERAHGAKYHIAPVRRELLVDLEVVIGAEGPIEVIERIEGGLTGIGSWSRYGLPFAGDNNLLFDRIDVYKLAAPCRWYTSVDLAAKPRQGATRLSRAIDRADSSKTVCDLVAPQADARHVRPPLIPSSKTVCDLVAPQSDDERTVDPPVSAWAWTPRDPVISP
jgi:CRISPR-associated protein Cas5t